MFRAADRSPLRGDAVLFASCLAIALAALLSPHAWTDPVAGWIRQAALRPLVLVQQRAEEGRTSRARLLEAMADRDSTAVLARDLAGPAGENSELRRLPPAGHRPRHRFRRRRGPSPALADGRAHAAALGREGGRRSLVQG